MKHVAVVGASLAGLSAVRALRAQGFDGQITVIGDEVRRPYDRPPLSKEFLLGSMSEADLALEADDDDLRAEWILGSPAIAFEHGTGTIELANSTKINADGVVLATGSRARQWPGCEVLPGVHVVRTVEDAVGLRADLQHGARLVVIGGGFVGAEVAATARKLGLDVTVVEAASVPLSRQLGKQLGAVIAGLHAVHGTDLICGVGVARIIGPDRVTGVELADGRVLPADVVVVGIGAVPNIEWLKDSGLELGDGIICGAGGQTVIPNVVAVGDCAAWYDAAAGTARRIEHWTGALERPAIAVATLLAAGDHQRAEAKPPYFWSDQYGSRIQFAGFARAGDIVTIEEGDCEQCCFLATYRRDGRLVAVLAVDQPRLFSRMRRQIGTAYPT